MILETGSKVLVSHRRLFEGDHSRYFLGLVEGYENGIARICGYTWTREGYKGEYHRKEDERTKIVSIVSGSVMLYALPSHLDLTSARIVGEGVEVFLTDASGWRMDMSEGVLHAGAPLPGRRSPEARSR